MKIVVCSDGESLDSPMADDFGHAPFFLLIDSDTLDYQVIVNEFKDSEQGAGMAVAKAIVGLGCVDAVLVGGIGMHGIKVLRDAGIDVSFDEDGIVEQCVEDYLRRIERRRRLEQEASERARSPSDLPDHDASSDPVLDDRAVLAEALGEPLDLAQAESRAFGYLLVCSRPFDVASATGCIGVSFLNVTLDPAPDSKTGRHCGLSTVQSMEICPRCYRQRVRVDSDSDKNMRRMLVVDYRFGHRFPDRRNRVQPRLRTGDPEYQTGLCTYLVIRASTTFLGWTERAAYRLPILCKFD